MIVFISVLLLMATLFGLFLSYKKSILNEPIPKVMPITFGILAGIGISGIGYDVISEALPVYLQPHPILLIFIVIAMGILGGMSIAKTMQWN